GAAETAVGGPPAPATPVVVAGPRHPFLETQVGLELGGGVAAFARGPLSSITDTGGTWDLRLIVGAHSPLGVELGYIGTANSVRMTGGSATLTSNAGEADIRLGTPSLFRIPLQAYGFGGPGGHPL